MGVLETIKKIGGKKVGRVYFKWEFSADSQILAQPVIVSYKNEDFVLFATRDGKVYLLSPDAKPKWRFDIEEKLSQVQLMFLEPESAKSVYGLSVADINSDRKPEIILASEVGKLYVLSIDGELLWHFDAGAPLRAEPEVFDINRDGKPEILFGCIDSNFHALNSQGKSLWKFTAESGIEGSCSVLNTKRLQIIFGSNDGTIYSLGAKGELLWKFSTGAKITAKPVIGRLYGDERSFIVIGSFDKYLYALNELGEIEWKFKSEGRIASKAVLFDVDKDNKLEVVFGCCDDNVYLLNCNGFKIWSYETDFWIVAPPLILDIDKDGNLEVVVGSYDHSIYVLDARGMFSLDYIPGVSAITQQAGSYTSLMTDEPGSYQGVKLWQLKTKGMVNGLALTEKGCIVSTTTNGVVNGIAYTQT